MCHGNLAEASAHYLNAQLTALWDNAKKCNNQQGPGIKPKEDIVKHAIALREFHGPNSTFHAVFQEAPRLEFVCDHELVLYIKIENGHYKASDSTVNIQDVILAIRLSYRVQDLNASLSGGPAFISLLCIEPASATLVREKSTSKSTIDFSLLFPLVKSHYLTTLVQAGSTHLLVLPPSATERGHIDHSVLINSVTSRDILFGIELDKINQVLGHHWLSAVGRSGEPSPHQQRSTYLAEYRLKWPFPEEDLWAYFELNPLRVQVLCEKEVILFVKADLHLFYSEKEIEQDRDSSYENWEVAIIFHVAKDRDRILLDRSIAPRILPNLCSLPGSQEGRLKQDAGSLTEFQRIFKKVILHEYVKLIFEFGHYQLYPDFTSSDTYRHPPKHSLPCQCGRPHSHGRPCVCGHYPLTGPKPEPFNWHPLRPDLPKHSHRPDISEDFTIDWAVLRSLFVQETFLYGYHQITSVTQAGINAHFAALWKTANGVRSDDQLAVLVRFNSKGKEETGGVLYLPHFKAQFGAPQVELITTRGRNSLILYYNIQKISFSLDKTVQEFKDWVLAFEFELRLLETKPLSPKATDASGLAKLHQLVLDISTAKLVHDRSSFAGLVDTKSPDVTRKLYGTLEKTFFERYIAAFAAAQLHVLYTLPIHSHEHLKKKQSTHGRAYAVTQLGFSIVPFSLSPFKGRTFQGLWGSTRHIVERNMILFHGVNGDGSIDRPLLPGPYGAFSEHPPHGHVLLARDAFLDSHILKPLAKVNALTTILCKFDGVDKMEWKLTLKTWQKVKGDVEDDCQWDKCPDECGKCLNGFEKRHDGFESHHNGFENHHNGFENHHNGFENHHNGLYEIRHNELEMRNECDEKAKKCDERPSECDKRHNECDEGLKYHWSNSEEWKYEAEGKGVRVGTYIVTANTDNTLIIPTVAGNGPLTITLEGLCTVHLEFAVHKTIHWSGNLKAKWKAPIMLTSDPVKGLCITTNEKVDIEFKTQSQNHTKDVFDIGEKTLKSLNVEFRKMFCIDISSAIEWFNKSFSGVYQGLTLRHTELVLANPIFNGKGDLFLQLLPKTGASAGTEGKVATGHGLGTAKTGRKTRREGVATSRLTLSGTKVTTVSGTTTVPTITTVGSTQPLSSFPLTPSTSDNTLVANTPLHPQPPIPEDSMTNELNVPKTTQKIDLSVVQGKLIDAQPGLLPPPDSTKLGIASDVVAS